MYSGQPVAVAAKGISSDDSDEIITTVLDAWHLLFHEYVIEEITKYTSSFSFLSRENEEEIC